MHAVSLIILLQYNIIHTTKQQQQKQQQQQAKKYIKIKITLLKIALPNDALKDWCPRASCLASITQSVNQYEKKKE